MSEDTIAENPSSADLDYLGGFIFGQWKSDVWMDAIRLAHAKAKLNWKPQYVTYNGLTFEVLPGSSGPPGVHRREIQMTCAGVYIGICYSGSDETRPALKLELKGEVLFRFGGVKGLELALEILAKTGFVYRESRVSRVDFRADFCSFTVEEVFQCFRNRQVVCRAKKYPSYFAPDGSCQSFYAGAGKAAVQCRFYDKLAETAGNAAKRLALEEVYGELPDVLTRVEFQLRRETITERYKISSFEDVFASLERITADLCRNWLRIDKQSQDSNSGRRRDDDNNRHSIWKRVQDSFSVWSSSFGDRVVRRVEKVGQTVEHAKRMMVASAARVAAMCDAHFDRPSAVWAFFASHVLSEPRSFAEFQFEVRKKKSEIEDKALSRCSDWFVDRQKPALPGLGTLFG